MRASSPSKESGGVAREKGEKGEKGAGKEMKEKKARHTPHTHKSHWGREVGGTGPASHLGELQQLDVGGLVLCSGGGERREKAL